MSIKQLKQSKKTRPKVTLQQPKDMSDTSYKRMMLPNTPETRREFVLRLYNHYNDVQYFQNVAAGVYDDEDADAAVSEILTELEKIDPYILAYPDASYDVIWELCTSGH
jgi:hypothetical protein